MIWFLLYCRFHIIFQQRTLTTPKPCTKTLHLLISFDILLPFTCLTILSPNITIIFFSFFFFSDCLNYHYLVLFSLYQSIGSRCSVFFLLYSMLHNGYKSQRPDVPGWVIWSEGLHFLRDVVFWFSIWFQVFTFKCKSFNGCIW